MKCVPMYNNFRNLKYPVMRNMGIMLAEVISPAAMANGSLNISASMPSSAFVDGVPTAAVKFFHLLLKSGIAKARRKGIARTYRRTSSVA